MTAPYRKGSLAEYEACHLLKQQGWIVSRWFGNPSPPDLFAARNAEILLVMVRHSRTPVPDAHAIVVLYGNEMDRLRSVGDPGFVQKECWVHAPPDGWKYYEVLPGGIRRIWRDWEVPVKAGTGSGKKYGTVTFGIPEYGQDVCGTIAPSGVNPGKTPETGLKGQV